MSTLLLLFLSVICYSQNEKSCENIALLGEQEFHISSKTISTACKNDMDVIIFNDIRSFRSSNVVISEAKFATYYPDISKLEIHDTPELTIGNKLIGFKNYGKNKITFHLKENFIFID